MMSGCGLSSPGCPNANESRELLTECLSALGITEAVVERLGPIPSPSIRTDGIDVMRPDHPDGRMLPAGQTNPSGGHGRSAPSLRPRSRSKPIDLNHESGASDRRSAKAPTSGKSSPPTEVPKVFRIACTGAQEGATKRAATETDY